jgi:hypothetical protein
MMLFELQLLYNIKWDGKMIIANEQIILNEVVKVCCKVAS